MRIVDDSLINWIINATVLVVGVAPVNPSDWIDPDGWIDDDQWFD